MNDIVRMIFRSPDLTSHHLTFLNEFVYQLVCSGQLMMAKLLRLQILEKVTLFVYKITVIFTS